MVGELVYPTSVAGFLSLGEVKRPHVTNVTLSDKGEATDSQTASSPGKPGDGTELVEAGKILAKGSGSGFQESREET